MMVSGKNEVELGKLKFIKYFQKTNIQMTVKLMTSVTSENLRR